MFNLTAAPSKPKGPLKVSDTTKSGCKLKWGKPEDDGGKPITSYQVEKLDKATGRWVPIGRTSDTEMDVKGLQEGHEYEFRVKAINEEGESEPLVTDGSTLAKNPYGNPSSFIFSIWPPFAAVNIDETMILDVAGKPGTPEFEDWDVDRSRRLEVGTTKRHRRCSDYGLHY